MTGWTTQRLIVPGSVAVHELDGESVLQDLESGLCFGLDDVGTRAWALLAASGSIQAAYEALLDEFDVEPDRLREDLAALLADLEQHGLVELKEAEQGEDLAKR